MKPGAPDQPRIYTIGHSTRPIEEFLDLLRRNGIRRLEDVRTIPRSRHNPQYERAALEASLTGAGIACVHRPDLGGFRKPARDSVNGAWRNASFRGFADYMLTPAFAVAVQTLVADARAALTAICCAEAVPWRCHRSLIADALIAHGAQVRDILGPASAALHQLTPFAHVEGTRVWYPAAEAGKGGG